MTYHRRPWRTTLPSLAIGLAVAMGGPAAAQEPALDVPFVPTPERVVQKMLEMAEVGPDDIVYDLGSGDGRIVIAAVRDFYARRGVGVDLDPARVEDGKRNAREAGVEDRTEFVEGDVFDFDFSEASVVTMYLLAEINLALRPRILSELRPGTRVVSHDFHMGQWTPDDSAIIDNRNVYFWVVPANVAGTWRWSDGERTFTAVFQQIFQRVDGYVTMEDRDIRIQNGTVRGQTLTFEVTIDIGLPPERFELAPAGDGTMAVRNANGEVFPAARAG